MAQFKRWGRAPVSKWVLHDWPDGAIVNLLAALETVTSLVETHRFRSLPELYRIHWHRRLRLLQSAFSS
jgi:hypothetical protein